MPLQVSMYVERDTRASETDRFYIHKDLYKTLINISAANPTTGTWLDDQPLLQAPSQRELSGGDLTAAAQPIAPVETRQLPNHTAERGAHRPEAEQRFEPDVLIEADRLADRMLESIGLEYSDIEGLLGSEALQRAATDMRKALDAHSLDNARLKGLLIEVEQEARSDLAEAYSELRRDLQGDPENRKLADQVDERLVELAPILILLPKLDLLSHLIESLEDAAAIGDDQDPQEQSLLELLRGTRQLMSEQNINTPQAWHLAAQHLRQGSGEDDDAEVLPFRTGSRGTGNA
jgi:hypothetical protein